VVTVNNHGKSIAGLLDYTTDDTRKVWGAKRGMTRSEGGILKLFKRASFCFFPNNNKFQFTTNAVGGRDKKVE